MKYRLIIPGNIFAFFLALTWIIFPGSLAWSFESLDEMVQISWEANPSLDALANQIEAMKRKVPQAGAWMDPMVAVEYSNLPVDSFEMGDHAMSGVQLKLQQTFPFPGKIHKRKLATSAEADVSSFELAEKQNLLRGMVKRAYWRLAENRLLEKITRRHIQEVERLLASVKSRFEVGYAGQHDLLRLTVLRDQLSDVLSEFMRRDIEITATLNGLMNRPPNTPIVTPENIVAVEPSLNSNKWYEKALAARPILKLWKQKAEAQRLSAERASHEGWPDPTVWVGYRFREEVLNDQGMVMDEGTDFFSVGLSLPLPIFYGQRWGAMKAENLAKERSYKSTYSSLAKDIRSEIEQAFAAWRRAYEKTQSYAGKILPGQQGVLNATFAAYQVGRSDFTSLYAAEVGLLDVERALLRARVETLIQGANIEILVGEGLPSQGDQK